LIKSAKIKSYQWNKALRIYKLATRFCMKPNYHDLFNSVMNYLNQTEKKNNRDRFTTHAALETAIELSLFIML
jgi:hypothetical protein